jgi:hypothetical protein
VALLGCVEQCASDLVAVDVGVAALQSLPTVARGRCDKATAGVLSATLALRPAAFASDPTAGPGLSVRGLALTYPPATKICGRFR